MGKFTLPILGLFLAAHSLADGDAVNERIPVDGPAMEAHWGIDCRAAWASYLDGAWQDPDQAGEPLHELRLCAFIYQPPGEEPARDVPDYRGAAEQLERGAGTGS